ncbi:MAG: MMPL family transporter [Deltaproteobacteria bacterium]|nr:MMPL family transporter [Deltaproteobacteria bacterium]
MKSLPLLALRRPRLTLLCLLLTTMLFAGGLPRLRSEFGYRVLLGDDHPSVKTLDAIIATFGGGLPLTIAWECGPQLPCATLASRKSLHMAHAITRTLEASPHVRRVQGLANAPLLVPAEGGFAVRRLVEAGEPARDAAALAQLAIDDPVWRDTFISRDGSVGAIVVQPVDTRSETDVGVVDAIFAALRPFEARGSRFHLVGDAVASVVSGRDLASSTTRLVPFTVLVIAGIVVLFTRSLQAALLCLATLGVALVWTFGALGWLHWPQDGILEVLAPLVLVIGVCDAIHLLGAYAEELGKADATTRPQRREAMQRAVLQLAAPCALTTLTTAAAFLSFLTSDLDTFERFGSIAAFATVSCLVLTFSLIPVLGVALAPQPAPIQSAALAWRAGLGGVVRVTQRRTGLVLAVAGGVMLFFACGWTRLEIDTDWYESWGQRSDVVQWLNFVETRLGPSETLELEITLPPGGNIAEPETLETLDALAQSIGSLDGLANPRSIITPLKRLNRLIHDDDPSFEKLGERLGQNAELLELLEFEGVDLLAPWITLDRSRVRISVAAREQSYRDRERTLAAVRRLVDSSVPAFWEVRLTGEAAIGFEWIRDVQATQLRSFPTALLLALILVGLLLRSLRLALAALVPTLLPIVVTLGGMGWLGMSVDVGRAMLAAVILGIAIDDAIHFLHRMRRDTLSNGDATGAIERTLLSVGPAITTTSIALALGFLTFMASAWQTISSFGFFMALAILGALASTLFVLPSLLFATRVGHAEDPDAAGA